ncbi:uncharacterized protein Z518_09220 [Rhinocladiella mackenziei CBS 650.93]|uniref:Heterokaryon incompatibility domain-containing protein n=1 Tax=Rhinocladiella mackenziei CBS 650.93 TaxID=1442369 RepID=A0A0D2I6R5_9EURO|nr:uncharacterized protein Z518_09220 [Rhinocladiella mackenziei CBS 650.93]KIX01494.1 hypothetical protein Z518_09220 [Rhinocladiella mackenziei CBS 650.93]
MDQAWTEWTNKRKLLMEGTFLESSPSTGTAEHVGVCVNLDERQGMIDKTDAIYVVDIATLIDNYFTTLERLYHCARDSGIKSCPNRECRLNKRYVSKAIPGQSTWCTSFLEWVVQWFSCSLTSLIHYHKGGAPLKTNLSLSVMRCMENPTFGGKWNFINPCVLPDRVIYDTIEWIYRVEIAYGRDSEGKSSLQFAHFSTHWFPELVSEEDFKKAINKAKILGVCHNRLWNIISCGPRGHLDLPALLDIINKIDAAQADLFRHGEDFGLRQPPGVMSFAGSSSDDTRVVQRHKCPESELNSCASIQFPTTMDKSADRLVWYYHVKSSQSQSQTATYTPTKASGDYIAISHVWSDGTGAGRKGPGLVNSCLSRFFCDIAKTLDCQGVWWDAISIPSDPNLRAKAPRNMQQNFSSAKHTVVHDEYLMRFPWKDDGTPCLILVLSPWFTRGWTAVELVSSKSLQVLFKNPDDDRRPLIKDLERDILSNHPLHTPRP